ncbi:hypothetical protein ElyMa_003396200 [Elysia marginata]|uniref:Uncharacterized protein n=1 Tax=Elysia marginata TaxID=1093978 RepID=A0AAV4JLR9_9GAST|nr:hypothetical protein ElyMa_003396200 [Elysia marginata]
MRRTKKDEQVFAKHGTWEGLSSPGTNFTHTPTLHTHAVWVWHRSEHWPCVGTGGLKTTVRTRTSYSPGLCGEQAREFFFTLWEEREK